MRLTLPWNKMNKIQGLHKLENRLNTHSVYDWLQLGTEVYYYWFFKAMEDTRMC